MEQSSQEAEHSPQEAEQPQKEIGRRIKARREYLRLSQEALAERTGVSRVTISNWERGERSISAVELPALAAALTVPLAYFYGDEETEGPLINSYYNGLSPARKATADELIRALWLEDQRGETTHGKKAE